jgi:hypothetical protein
VIFGDTELDPELAGEMLSCCVENFHDFREHAPLQYVEAGQELICPECGGVTVLDPDGRWRWIGD